MKFKLLIDLPYDYVVEQSRKDGIVSIEILSKSKEMVRLNDMKKEVKSAVDSFYVGKVFCVKDVWKFLGNNYKPERSMSNKIVKALSNMDCVEVGRLKYFEEYGTQKSFTKVFESSDKVRHKVIEAEDFDDI